MPADIAALTAADFEPRINDDFRIAMPDGAVALKLVEVRAFANALRQGGGFSLTFRTPPGPFLAQSIYPLDHPALGTLEIFLVPLGPKDGGNSYEAIFT
jgi:hypothetical protein